MRNVTIEKISPSRNSASDSDFFRNSCTGVLAAKTTAMATPRPEASGASDIASAPRRGVINIPTSVVNPGSSADGTKVGYRGKYGGSHGDDCEQHAAAEMDSHRAE